MPLARRLLRPKERYLLRDNFDLPLAAGAVTGTFAAPGPGIRTVTDTESKLSIAGGALTIAGGKAAPAWGDPGIWYPAATRILGRALFATVTPSKTTDNFEVGFGSSVSGALLVAVYLNSTAAISFIDGANTARIGVFAVNTYQLALVLPVTGAHYFVKGGLFLAWTYLGKWGVSNTSTLYPSVSISTAVFTADNLRIPDRLYIPAPLAYDTFARADGVLGSSEAVGPDGQQTPQLAWSGATWAISSGKAVNTPTTGDELVTNPGFEGVYVTEVAPNWTRTRGTFTESADVHGGSAAQQINNPAGNTGYGNSANVAASSGNWIVASCWSKALAGSGILRIDENFGAFTSLKVLSAISNASYANNVFTARAVNTGNHVLAILATLNATADINSICFDDASIKIISLSTLFATHAYSTTNILADVTLAAYTTGTQAGLVLRLDSAASPANFIIAYQDAGNVKIDECVAGTYTNLGTYASAYAAADSLRVSLDGNAWRLYKITSAGAATLLGSGTTAVTTGTLHGMFSTDAANTLDNWQCWARGNEGQYEGLSAL